MVEAGVLFDFLEIVNDVRGSEVDLQFLQLDAIGRNWKEAGDSRGTGVLETGVSKEKRL